MNISEYVKNRLTMRIIVERIKIEERMKIKERIQLVWPVWIWTLLASGAASAGLLIGFPGHDAPAWALWGTAILVGLWVIASAVLNLLLFEYYHLSKL